MKQNMNLVQCTGKVLRKYYDEEKGILQFDLGIFVPGKSGSGIERKSNRDFPRIHVEKDAALINERIMEGDQVSFIGHSETRPVLHYQGKRTYKRNFDTVVIVEDIVLSTGVQGNNSVSICGECTRIYRNDDKGKKFYIITVKTTLSDASEVFTEFVFFDHRMELEPKVGDMIYMNGALRTKNLVQRGTNRRQIVLTIVARSAAIC